MGERELRRAIDADIEVKPAFFGLDLGDVDMEVADRVDPFDKLRTGLKRFFSAASPSNAGSRLIP